MRIECEILEFPECLYPNFDCDFEGDWEVINLTWDKTEFSDIENLFIGVHVKNNLEKIHDKLIEAQIELNNEYHYE